MKRLALGAAIVALRFALLIAMSRYERTHRDTWRQVALGCALAEAKLRIALDRMSA